MAGIRILFIPFIVALLLHGVLISLFLFSFESKPVVVKNKPIPEIIQASVLDENKVMAEAQRIKTEQNNKKIASQKKQKKLQRERQKEERRITELKKKRLAEEELVKQRKREQKKAAVQEQQKIKKLQQQRLKQEQLIAEQKKKLAEQASLEKQRIAKEKKRKEQERQQKIAKEKLRQQQQEVMRKEAERLKIEQQQAIAEQRRLAEQQAEQEILAKLKADQESKAMHTAQYAIQRKVNSRWVRPLSVRNGLKCTIRVKLLASGDVVQAVVVKSSGDPVFDRSAETAVRKAAPLPVPTDYDLFSREFRSFDFIFNPK